MHKKSLLGRLESVLDSRTVQRVGGAINTTLQFRNPVAVTVGESKLFAQTLDRLIMLLAVKFSLWEQAERRFVRKTLKEGDVAVDVGANIGQYTVEFSHLVGSEGRVIAFEPAPSNFRLLKMAVEANECSNAVINEMAVADTSGWVDLRLSDLHHGDHRIIETDDGRKELNIPTISLDDYLSDEPRVNLIKIDVQGAEPLVLQGMRRIVADHPELKVLMEFSPELLKAAKTSPHELHDQIRSLGLEVGLLDENGDVDHLSDLEEALIAAEASMTLVLMGT